MQKFKASKLYTNTNTNFKQQNWEILSIDRTYRCDDRRLLESSSELKRNKSGRSGEARREKNQF